MATREYCIVLVGPRASGKTTLVRMLKDLPPETIKDNKYHATIGSEVSPMFHQGRLLNIYDMGKFSTFNNLPSIDAAILLTKRANPELPVLPGGPPIIVVNNHDYTMARADIDIALDQIVSAFH